MTRRLTVLGGCGAYPEPGRACSGFLVEWDGFRLVMDLGYGTATRLPAVDAVAITHEHPDHCVDLHALFRRQYYGGAAARLPLYCPPGVPARLAGLEPDVDLLSVFDFHPLPGEYRVGPFELRGTTLPHHVPNAGIRLTADGCALAYTGDTGPTPLLAELGRDADVFIVEATDRPGPPTGNLLTARAAGEWAQAAGAHRLLLTHFWPGNDREAARARAAETFPGEVLIADEDVTIPLAR